MVSLNRAREQHHEAIVGEWTVVHGMAGKAGFNGIRLNTLGEDIIEPMREDDWRKLVNHSVHVLTLLGVESSQAEVLADENIEMLKSQMGSAVQQGPTAVESNTWGRVKEGRSYLRTHALNDGVVASRSSLYFPALPWRGAVQAVALPQVIQSARQAWRSLRFTRRRANSGGLLPQSK